MLDSLLAWLEVPPWWAALPLLALGLAGLAYGAERLLDGAVALARRTGLSRAVIGATVVACGTSAPELVVGLSAAGRAVREPHIDPDGPIAITVANVVGASIANLGLILAVTCLLSPIAIDHVTRRLTYPAVFVTMVVFILVAWPWTGVASIAGWEAAVLLAVLVVSLTLTVRSSRAHPVPDTVAEVDEMAAQVPGLGVAWWLTGSGLVLLIIAGQSCLSGAVGLATAGGLSERVIGLTVVSIGTALPELFASLSAARRGHADMAIGNVLGSVLFNICAILGLVGLIVSLPINTGTLHNDLWWLTGFILVLGIAVIGGWTLNRRIGLLLLAGYVAYVALLFIAPVSSGGTSG